MATHLPILCINTTRMQDELHITNDPIRVEKLEAVNPLVNDLAAPLKILAGSYSTQTAINDKRLQSFPKNISDTTIGYYNVHLYQEKDPFSFSMNWVISNYLLEEMDKRVKKCE